jgi:putative transcriptional regulator
MQEIQQGSILISQPFTLDQYFKRTVVYIVEHHINGDLGFIFNKELNQKVKDVIPNFPDIDLPLYSGGPVANNQLFFLHNIGDEIDGAMHVRGNVFWGGNFEQVINGLRIGTYKPQQIRCFIGYAGWDENQIDEEIESKAWFLADAEKLDIMKANPETLWGDGLKAIGSNYAKLAEFPEDFCLN